MESVPKQKGCLDVVRIERLDEWLNVHRPLRTLYFIVQLGQQGLKIHGGLQLVAEAG